ncbi:FimV/HubP family polar landmark protein [Saccharospirillum salsuginis]|uniref:Motility protein FimV n=1 Tax=Saccharospirillum salsuginis TaxID=418750 RepID=A0A918KSP4_9GAMM|nr:FimV/HubP family polar landmark protein [Saccharospirillum salsuginis]GGX74465.1 motility protein FimV [Saccharospirillum salsuginis]
MFKKQALTLVISALAFTSTAQALGLGDIELESNLNEPLDAEIELLELRGLTAGEILPTLASNDAFVRAGVERNFFLSNIKFDVRENEAGELVISLSTNQPVREPFLNFLVEVNWPGGRLLKEFTLLLDPPVFDTGVVGESLVVEPAEQPSGETEITTTTTVSQPETTTETVPAEVTPREENLGPNEYRVKRNDTLWEIAAGLPAGSGYSPQQVMLAIQDLNPNAFLNNNINRLKAGSLLNLPDEAQIATRTVQEAIDEVRQQNAGGSARPRVADDSDATEVQLSATESTSSALPEGEGERDPDGYLEVAADDETEGTSAGGESSTNAEIERLENELAIAGELNDQFEREKEELESRVVQLEEQIAIMQRLLNVQSGDAATLQAELAEREAEAAAEGESGSAQAPADTEASSPAQTGDSSDASEPAQPAMDGQASGEQEPAQTPEPAAQPQEQQQQATQPQAQPQPAQPEPGIMGFVQQYTAPVTNWVTGSLYNMIITAAGAIILLMIPLYLRSRNKSEDIEEEAPALAEGGLSEPQFEQDFDDDLLGDFEEEAELDATEEAESDATSDAVMEAEMYMAYQKYEQAEEKLKSAFAEEPGRTDIGLKLLEVYSETGNAAAFDDLEKRLSLTSDQQAQVDEFRNRMPMSSDSDAEDLSMDLDEDSDLDFGDFDTSTEEDSEDIPSLDDLEQDLKTETGSYDLSDFDTESDTAEPASTETREEEVASSESDDLDFSLDLDDLDIETETDSKASDELDLDLGDLGLEESEPEPEARKTESDESASLDFSLDEEEGEFDSDLDFNLDETEKPAEPELPTLETGDDDLDLDFSSLEESEPEPAESDELPTDDSLTLDEDNLSEEEPTGGEEVSFDFTDESAQAEPERAVESATAQDDDNLRELADALPGSADLEDDEFDFLSGSDEASTKLDLARAYIEMDDKEGARDILEEVATEGNDDQKKQAKELMDQL